MRTLHCAAQRSKKATLVKQMKHAQRALVCMKPDRPALPSQSPPHCNPGPGLRRVVRSPLWRDERLVVFAPLFASPDLEVV